MKYCKSVCIDGALFDGTGKRVLIGMFSGIRAIYSYLNGELEMLFSHLT